MPENWEALRDDVAHVFQQNLNLKGAHKRTLFKDEAFKRIAIAYRKKNPNATDLDVLRCVLIHFSAVLKAT